MMRRRSSPGGVPPLQDDDEASGSRSSGSSTSSSRHREASAADTCSGGGKEVVRLQLLHSKAQASLREKDEQISKMSSRLKAMEEAAAKLKTKVKALEELRVLAVEWQGELGSLRGQVDDLRAEKEGLAAQIMAKQKAMDCREAQAKAQAEELELLSMRVRELTMDKAGLEGQLKNARDAAELERQSREGVQQAGEAQRQALQHLSDQGSALRARVGDLEAQLTEARRQLLEARGEKDDMAKEVQVARDLTTREVVLKAEVAALKKDMGRLLKLLVATQEYEGFRQYWEDSQGAHHISDPGQCSPPALPDTPPRRHHAAAPQPPPPPPSSCWLELERLAQHYPLDPDLAVELRREVLSWVPSRAVRVMREFWVRHMPPHLPVTGGVLDRLLLDLNEVWRAKEDVRVQRMKARYESTLKELRRQVGNCRSYDNVMADTVIARLKKEIQALRAKAQRPRMLAFDRQSPHVLDDRHSRHRVLQSSLQAIERLAQEVSAAAPLTSSHDPSGQAGAEEGGRFLAGALWMGRKAVAVVDEMGEEVDDSQKQSIDRLSDQMAAAEEEVEEDAAVVRDQLSRVLSAHHQVLLDVQSSTQTCRARVRELVLQASAGRLGLC